MIVKLILILLASIIYDYLKLRLFYLLLLNNELFYLMALIIYNYLYSIVMVKITKNLIIMNSSI